MEEQTQSQSVSAQPSSTSPIPVKQNNKPLTIATILIFLFMAGGLVYLGYQNYQLQQKLSQLLEQKANQNQPLPSPTASSPSPISKDSQNQAANIKLSADEYRLGGLITFTILNNTQKAIYYFPETCASNLVHVFIIKNNESSLIQGDPKICALAPSVETLPPNKSITSKIPEKTLSKITPGSYMIKFEYSTVKRDQFGIGEHSIVESEIFTVVQ